MGGYGSGRRSNRPTTDDCLRINLSNLKQLGMLQRHCMARREQVRSQYGETIAKLTLVTDVHCLQPSPRLTITGHAFGKVINCVIPLDEYALPYGGARWFALCPRTGRRCTALVLPPASNPSNPGWIKAEDQFTRIGAPWAPAAPCCQSAGAGNRLCLNRFWGAGRKQDLEAGVHAAAR